MKQAVERFVADTDAESPKSCPPYSSVRGAVRGSDRWGIFGHLLRCALQRKTTVRL